MVTRDHATGPPDGAGAAGAASGAGAGRRDPGDPATTVTRAGGTDAPGPARPGAVPRAAVPRAAGVRIAGGSRSAEARRRWMVPALRARGEVVSPAVDTALSSVDRQTFLPHASLDVVYGGQPVATRHPGRGEAVREPAVVQIARMLELLGIGLGDRVLVFGAGTGYMAALVDHMVGVTGEVLVVEHDGDVAAVAHENLMVAGNRGAQVRCADPAAWPRDGQRWPRILVTGAVAAIPDTWWEQLGDTGRVVAALQMHGSGLVRLAGLDRAGGVLVGEDPVPAVVPALQCGQSLLCPPTATPLGRGLVVDHDPADAGHTAGLAAAFTQAYRAGAPWRRWLGHTVGVENGRPDQSRHLDLWLAGTRAVARLRGSRAAGDPILNYLGGRWGRICLLDRGCAAWLISRPHGRTTEEIGVSAVGEHAGELGDLLAGLVSGWHTTARYTAPTVTIDRHAHSGAALVDRVLRW